MDDKVKLLEQRKFIGESNGEADKRFHYHKIDTFIEMV